MYKKITIFSIIFFLIDQISKLIFEHILILNTSKNIIKNFFSLTLCHNNGIAWSLLSNKRYLIIIMTLIALIFIISLIKDFKENKRNIISFSLLIGGLLGNLLDRIVYGYVIDFLDFNIFGYDYPIFNLSDTFIVISIFLLIISIIKGDDKSANSSNKK